MAHFLIMFTKPACRIAPPAVALLALAGLGSLSTSPFALAAPGDQSSTTGRAQASIVSPLTATPLAPLDFGTLTVGEHEGGTVIISARDGSVNFTGAARPACSAGQPCAPAPARFRVTGEAGRSYRVMLPASLTANGGASASGGLEVTGMEARSLSKPDEAMAGQLDSQGQDLFYVGGTLAIPAGTAPDQYVTSVPVVVAYD